MKTVKYFSKLICMIFLLIGLIVVIKQSLGTFEKIPVELNTLELQRVLYNELRMLIKTEDFIELYGKSKIKPMFLTRYYVYVMCDPDFLIKFIEGLTLNEVKITTKNIKEFMEQAESLFFIYVEESQKNYENNIKFGLYKFIRSNIIMDLFSFKDFFFGNHPDILTPLAVEDNIKYYTSLKDKVFPCVILLTASFLKYTGWI